MNTIFVVSILLAIGIIVLGYNRSYEKGEVPYEMILRAIFCGDILGLLQVGIIGYVEVVAPAHLKGTAISLASGCMFFIGRGVGGFLGGWVNNLVGTRKMLIML